MTMNIQTKKYEDVPLAQGAGKGQSLRPAEDVREGCSPFFPLGPSEYFPLFQPPIPSATVIKPGTGKDRDLRQTSPNSSIIISTPPTFWTTI